MKWIYIPYINSYFLIKLTQVDFCYFKPDFWLTEGMLVKKFLLNEKELDKTIINLVFKC